MNRTSKWIILALSIVIIGLFAALAYAQWQKPATNNPNNTVQQTVDSFASCVAAGNAIVETSPRQCRDAVSGKTFTENTPEPPAAQTPSTRTFTSTKGVKVEVNDWVDNKLLTSPATVTGRVPGNWSFEASFPVDVVASNNTTLVTTPATLNGDWMTTEMVPFTAMLTFDSAAAGDTGALVLRKDNPSGLSENDDSITIPVRFR